MNLKQLFLVFTAVFIFTGCTEILPEEQLEVQTNDLAPVSLKNGISPLLTPEQTKLFDATELKELDKFIKNPEQAIEFRDEHVVRVPAGSQDALMTAIEETPEGGTVLLETGEHLESSTVMINKHINITGEEGAILISGVVPAEEIGFIQAALHVKDVAGVRINNISFQTSVPIGGTTILLENAPKAIIVSNTMDNYEFGILVDESNGVRIAYNNINTSLAWTTGEIISAFGVVNINGKNTRIMANTFSGSVFGTWACDKGGLYIGNESFGNLYGMILCTVPDQNFPFPDGTFHFSATSATKWLVSYNSSHDNFDTGYLVIDNANNSFLYFNKAANNPNYDIELAGDSERFGFLTPTSFETRVVALPGQIIKDCGRDNLARGGIMVDTNTNPCF